jgi:hypothetical protein
VASRAHVATSRARALANRARAVSLTSASLGAAMSRAVRVNARVSVPAASSGPRPASRRHRRRWRTSSRRSGRKLLARTGRTSCGRQRPPIAALRVDARSKVS